MLSRKKIEALVGDALSGPSGPQSRLGMWSNELLVFARLVEAEALRKVARAEFSYARRVPRKGAEPVFVVNVWDLRDQARRAAKAAKEGK